MDSYIKTISACCGKYFDIKLMLKSFFNPTMTHQNPINYKDALTYYATFH